MEAILSTIPLLSKSGTVCWILSIKHLNYPKQNLWQNRLYVSRKEKSSSQAKNSFLQVQQNYDRFWWILSLDWVLNSLSRSELVKVKWVWSFPPILDLFSPDKCYRQKLGKAHLTLSWRKELLSAADCKRVGHNFLIIVTDIACSVPEFTYHSMHFNAQ